MEVEFKNGCVRIFGGRCENYVNLTGETKCGEIIKHGGIEKDLNKIVEQIYSNFNQELIEGNTSLAFKLPNPGFIDPPVSGGLDDAVTYEKKCCNDIKVLIKEYGL